MLSRRAFQLAAPAAWVAICAPARLHAAPARELFTLERSTNRNVVKYAVRLTQDGRLHAERPIEAYWLMLEENGRREGLTWAERQLAYGFSVSAADDSSCVLHLMACPDRALRVSSLNGRYGAELAIARQCATLERIFVCTEEHALLPTVRYVEIFGLSAAGQRVKERLLPRRVSRF